MEERRWGNGVYVEWGDVDDNDDDRVRNWERAQ